ncbi:hypothetical protein EDC61_10672 [Sulfuritortus calidifontis]|uniref:Uncharacterized protein n=1 Tax=Sulfuritortus calidifontis TaxID=1914471 RepID=A0A4R3JY06_9PROT|nr:hypothetical protein EDC61_10672 [Sulfuritortus calidifontis]
MVTAYPWEINPEVEDAAGDHVLNSSELSEMIDPDAIIGLTSKPYNNPPRAEIEVEN